MFQLAYLYFTQPRRDTVAWQGFVNRNYSFLNNRNASPRVDYNDSISAILYDHHPRTTPMTQERLSKANYDRILQIYRNAFSDASQFRATIIGNWCAENGEAVFGYTDFIDNPGEYVEIPSWTVDNPGEGASFDGLPGTGWVRATDGFFYYTTAVEPGAATGSALFTSYTPATEHPDYQIAGKYVDSHFVMEIATQAVNANNPDGTTMSWQEAWTKALGTAPATN